MSDQHHIDFRVLTKSRIELLEALLSVGWRIDDHGKISFITSNDDDMFDWQSRNLDFDIYSVLHRCEAAQSRIGVVISFEDTQIGGTLVMAPIHEGMVEGFLNIGMNLRRTDALVDLNWYLERLVPVLQKFTLRSLSYEFAAT